MAIPRTRAGNYPAILSLAVDWHAHELLFGYLAAIVTGFLLFAANVLFHVEAHFGGIADIGLPVA